MERSAPLGSLQRFYFRNGDRCPFCNLELQSFKGRVDDDQTVLMCQTCGWWRSNVDAWIHSQPALLNDVAGPFSTLRFACVQNLAHAELSSALDTPIQQLRDILVRDWSLRFSAHPNKMEGLVGSLFRDHGYDVIVTSYSGDGGIDVLTQRDGKVSGIQVKRYRESIEVSQIREFIGALFLKGIESGVFVTTSTFQRGARNLVREAMKKDISIALVDGDQFLSELKNAQLLVKRDLAEAVPSPDNGLHFLCGYEDGACSGTHYTTHLWDSGWEELERFSIGDTPIPVLSAKVDSHRWDVDWGEGFAN